MAGRATTSVAALVLFLTLGAPAAAQGTAIVRFTDREQIPLKAYAEFMRAGILHLTSGSAKDIPTIESFRMLRTSLTGGRWR